MKFRGHETFAIRKNWISKGLKKTVEIPALFFNKDRNPMDDLGIGSNMVKSLRYWLTSVGLLREAQQSRKRIHELTELGQLVWQYDKYTEEWGTLWLMHYSLVKNQEEATAWYYFFNEFSLSEFSKEDFVYHINNYIALNNSSVAVKSLDDDFRCIINTYMPRYKTNPGKDSPEDNMECPLSELGLIDYQSSVAKTYKKVNAVKDNIPALILLAVMIEQAAGKKEISLTELLSAKCNIGKVFNLDVITMLSILTQLSNDGLVKVVRTAGLDMVRITTPMTFLECVERYYRELA